MSTDIARWLSTPPAQRQHNRELDAVDRRTDLAVAQVEGVARVQKRALFETMQVSLLRREAERLAPDGAELYALLAVAGVSEMAAVITGMHRSGGSR